MKELFESIWNAPKEEIISSVGNAFIGGFVVVIIIIALIYYFVIRDI